MEPAAPNSPLQITIRPEATGRAVNPANTAPSVFWNSQPPTFKDILDTVNPLQHIPIVSNIYQSVSGETPSTASKLAGGALFGGPIGFFASLLDSIFQSATGADMAGHLVATIKGEELPAAHAAANDNATAEIADANPAPFLSANQRASYNAYVRASNLS